jgi:hypothetical protein
MDRTSMAVQDQASDAYDDHENAGASHVAHPKCPEDHGDQRHVRHQPIYGEPHAGKPHGAVLERLVDTPDVAALRPTNPDHGRREGLDRLDHPSRWERDGGPRHVVRDRLLRSGRFARESRVPESPAFIYLYPFSRSFSFFKLGDLGPKLGITTGRPPILNAEGEAQGGDDD